MKKLYLVLASALLMTALLSIPGQAENEEENRLLDPGTYAGLRFRNIGPALMSGRISDNAVIQGNPAREVFRRR